MSNLNTQRRLLTFCFAARIEQVYFKRTDNWFIGMFIDAILNVPKRTTDLWFFYVIGIISFSIT